eukprot:TRINITY_DN2306_c0_g2_i2.p1 TRINITY_DN2306_c0_g2~~TRINITY_DN2306_c0_g2_i2.p1  ORF type:complete len:291 (+),score=32.79 TRINITY_DN2306_c0_g2_i2:613-1485(+)
MVTALSSCMTTPDLIILTVLYSETIYAEGLLSIDDTKYLKDDKVWIFSGKLDTVVDSGVVEKLAEYYGHYVSSENIVSVFNVSAEHSMITNDFGGNCSYLGAPYINDCSLDAAGEILNHIYGALSPPVPASPENFLELNQSGFIPGGVDAHLVGLDTRSYAYVPSQCKNETSKCALHIAFHGCKQTLDLLNMTFVVHAGYNEWAEANNIIIAYPQAYANLVNPEGCFDWWGYSGENFATQLGIQNAVFKNTADYFAGDGPSFLQHGRDGLVDGRTRYLELAALSAKWMPL